MSLSFLLPVGVLLSLLVRGVNKDINFALWEKKGNLFQRPLEILLRRIPEHALPASDLSSLEKEIDDAFRSLEKLNDEIGRDLQFTDEGLGQRQREHVKVKTVRGEWNDLKEKSRIFPPEEFQKRHVHLIEDVRTMITHAGDTSNLILDPDLDSYYLMDVTLLALPQTQDRLAGIISEGRKALADGVFTKDEKIKMAVHAAQLRQDDMERIMADVRTVLNEDKNFYGVVRSLQNNLPPAAESYRAASENFAGILRRMAEDGGTAADGEAFSAAGRRARDESFRLWDAAAGELDVLLQKRIDAYGRSRARAVELSFLALLAASAMAYLITRDVTGSLGKIVEALRSQASLDFTRRVDVLSREDEIGLMARHMNAVMEKLSGVIGGVVKNTTTLAGSSDVLAKVSRSLSRNADETADQAGGVSASAEQISRNLQTVAIGAAEMNTSIREVADNAARAAQVAISAVSVAGSAAANVEKLGRSGGEIEDVLMLITSIAEQTNLLALNATIEAARAGEAGKGFAVVAAEVKELAKETAHATEDIARRIAAIKTDTAKTSESIGKVSGIIEDIKNIQNTIAAAVEQQSVTAGEIGRNVGEAAKGSAQIVQNFMAVVAAAQNIQTGAGETQKSASDLAEMAANLKDLMSQFKVEKNGNA